MINNKKAMAIPIVMLIIVMAFTTILMIASYHKQDRQREIIQREHIRARYLAKGAIQLALLKIRMLPQEFIDANIFFDSYGTIENMVNPPQDTTYLGERDDKNPGTWIHPGEFIRELNMTMTPGATPGFSSVADLKNGLICDGPFIGSFVITKLHLLTRRQGSRSDSVKIIAWAQENSGIPVGLVTGGSPNGVHEINEGQIIEEIHEIRLK
jgi:hypothetical protein